MNKEEAREAIENISIVQYIGEESTTGTIVSLSNDGTIAFVKPEGKGMSTPCLEFFLCEIELECDPPAWDEIPYDTQEALLKWFNVVEDHVTYEDREALAQLHKDGHFTHFDCARCKDEIIHGDPPDWGNFQGVNQSEYLGQLCGDCSGEILKWQEYLG